MVIPQFGPSDVPEDIAWKMLLSGPPEEIVKIHIIVSFRDGFFDAKVVKKFERNLKRLTHSQKKNVFPAQWVKSDTLEECPIRVSRVHVYTVEIERGKIPEATKLSLQDIENYLFHEPCREVSDEPCRHCSAMA